jgi:hypothetical protein
MESQLNNYDKLVREGIEKIIQEYLEANLAIRVEPDAYMDGRSTVFILLGGKEIDYDYIYY